MAEDRIKLMLTLLNDIEVKGEKNINNLLASIQLATGLLQEIQKNGGSQSDRGSNSSGNSIGG